MFFWVRKYFKVLFLGWLATSLVACGGAEEDGLVNVVVETDGGYQFTTPAVMNYVENDQDAIITLKTNIDLLSNVDLPDFILEEGEDASLFDVEASGVLSFKNPPDYENPLDRDRNNVYQLTVSATYEDITVSQPISINVRDEDEPHQFVSSNRLDLVENSHTPYIPELDFQEPGVAITYRLEGEDADDFTVDRSTGYVTFKQAPDYESPQDANGDNEYEITLVADGVNEAKHDLTIRVSDQGSAGPVFSSSNHFSLAEQSQVRFLVEASDPDQGDVVSYQLASLNNDHLLFSFNETTGALAFKNPPDYELPADANRDNHYELLVSATDNENTTTLSLRVSVNDVNEYAPSFSEATKRFTQVEGHHASFTIPFASDTDGTATLEYSLQGGDHDRFEITSSTTNIIIQSKAILDFESPLDVDENNDYQFELKAFDGLNSAVLPITLSVTNIGDNSLKFSQETAAFQLDEGILNAYEFDQPVGDDHQASVSYSLKRADKAFFELSEVDQKIRLNVKNALDFESPQDSNQDNVYDVEIYATDGTTDDSVLVSLTVLNVNDLSPVFSPTAQNFSTFGGNNVSFEVQQATDADGLNPLTYTLEGLDKSLFQIGLSEGKLMLAARNTLDFDQPSDSDQNNQYQLEVRASDGNQTATLSVSIFVDKLNVSAPEFEVGALSLVLDEGSMAGLMVDKPEDEDGLDGVSYRLEGEDQSHFVLSEQSTQLVLTPKVAFDYESPTDANQNNQLVVQIIADDGEYTDTLSVTISVNNLNDSSPEFSSGAQAFSLSEGQQGRFDLPLANDADNLAAIEYALSGSDASLFELDEANGQLALVTKQVFDFEAPVDLDTNNVYQLTLTASDGTQSDALPVSVSVTDEADHPPTFSKSAQSLSFDENSMVSFRVDQAEDVDGDALSYELTGDDSGYFSLTEQGTELVITSQQSFDYESPDDANSDNEYVFKIVASDGSQSSKLEVTLAIDNLNDHAPEFSESSLVVSADEGRIRLEFDKAVDPDGLGNITYRVRGLDKAFFDIEESADLVVVTSKAALDYSAPQDSDGNNVYHLTVNGNDGRYSDSIYVTLTILNTNQYAPVFTSSSSDQILEGASAQVYQATASDQDGDAVSFSLAPFDASQPSTADNQWFTLSASGALQFKATPSFDTPKDANRDNVYQVTMIASDGSKSTQHSLELKITSLFDQDNDHIPDAIEAILGKNAANDDENNNGVIDGLEGDPFFQYLWHLKSSGTQVNYSGVSTIAGNDLNVFDYVYRKFMGYNSGNPIIVQVVDDGVDIDHEDLADNIDLYRSLDGNIYGGDPSPVNPSDNHGTKVAGIIAARGFNETGVRGVAPFAKIAGSNYLQEQNAFVLYNTWYTGRGANEISVSNNSFGPATGYSNNSLYGELAMSGGTSELRDGKGRIYVFAAGNDRLKLHDANLDKMLSNRYPIAVAALNHHNEYASYSSPGANLFVSGYGGEYFYSAPTIGSTTVPGTSRLTGVQGTQTTWDDDTDTNYTHAMNGTSAAAPTVSGALALVLEACPDLTWRDVKHLIATESKQIDLDNESWVENQAGFKHSRDYGFGLINPAGMIQTCLADDFVLLAAETSKYKKETFDTTIPDDAYQISKFTIPISSNLKTEWVQITIDNNSSYSSDYKIGLVSPSGTMVYLLDGTNNSSAQSGIPTNWMNGGFRFGTPGFWGEASEGDWSLWVTDIRPGDTGKLEKVELEVFGTEITE